VEISGVNIPPGAETGSLYHLAAIKKSPRPAYTLQSTVEGLEDGL